MGFKSFTFTKGNNKHFSSLELWGLVESHGYPSCECSAVICVLWRAGRSGQGCPQPLALPASDIPGNMHLESEAQRWAFPGSRICLHPVTAPSAKTGKATSSLNTSKCLLLNMTQAIQCAELLGSRVCFRGRKWSRMDEEILFGFNNTMGVDFPLQPWEVFGTKLAPQVHVPWKVTSQKILPSHRSVPWPSLMAVPWVHQKAPLGEL